MVAYGDALRRYLPVDSEGELVNRLVAFVVHSSHVTRVGQVCEEFSLSERTLQRLVHRRLGLTPKWLIQRRRVAGGRRPPPRSFDDARAVAAALGYADQPHFIRDFAKVTTMTPGEFASLHGR